jgi:endonuclease YncB( thermonuclease family)
MKSWRAKPLRNWRRSSGQPRPGRWQIDGIDVRVPLLIVSTLGLVLGMSFAPGELRSGASAPSTARITGTATVIDGDTIEIHGIRIRLEGTDAPESRQLCLDRRDRVPLRPERGLRPR